MYSHPTMTVMETNPANSGSQPAGLMPRSARGVDPAGGPRRIRVGIIGATGYVGGELVRILARHPNVELVGLVGRERDHDAIDGIHAHLATTGLTVHAELPEAGVDAVFLALPHGTGAAARGGAGEGRRPRSSTSGPTSGCATWPTTRAGTASSIRTRNCSTTRSTGCRSCIAPSSKPWSMRRRPSSARPAAIRRPRSSRWRRWRGPG